jgi:hypothetical protein
MAFGVAGLPVSIALELGAEERQNRWRGFAGSGGR